MLGQRLYPRGKKSNLHVGKPGERLTLDLTLVRTREIPGHYGSTLLHSFEDAAGNLLVRSAPRPRQYLDVGVTTGGMCGSGESVRNGRRPASGHAESVLDVRRHGPNPPTANPHA